MLHARSMKVLLAALSLARTPHAITFQRYGSGIGRGTNSCGNVWEGDIFNICRLPPGPGDPEGAVFQDPLLLERFGPIEFNANVTGGGYFERGGYFCSGSYEALCEDLAAQCVIFAQAVFPLYDKTKYYGDGSINFYGGRAGHDFNLWNSTASSQAAKEVQSRYGSSSFATFRDPCANLTPEECLNLGAKLAEICVPMECRRDGCAADVFTNAKVNLCHGGATLYLPGGDQYVVRVSPIVFDKKFCTITSGTLYAGATPLPPGSLYLDYLYLAGHETYVLKQRSIQQTDFSFWIDNVFNKSVFLTFDYSCSNYGDYFYGTVKIPLACIKQDDFVYGSSPTPGPPASSPPPTTKPPATAPPTTKPPATAPPTTKPPATAPPTTKPPATAPPTTKPPATAPPTTKPPVTAPPTTKPPATAPPTTKPPATAPPTTKPPATAPPTTKAPAGVPTVTILGSLTIALPGIDQKVLSQPVAAKSCNSLDDSFYACKDAICTNTVRLPTGSLYLDTAAVGGGTVSYLKQRRIQQQDVGLWQGQVCSSATGVTFSANCDNVKTVFNVQGVVKCTV